MGVLRPQPVVLRNSVGAAIVVLEGVHVAVIGSVA
jgi:hypothetical protein